MTLKPGAPKEIVELHERIESGVLAHSLEDVRGDARRRRTRGDGLIAYLDDISAIDIDGDGATGEHDCPVHDDLAYDFEALNAYERRTLEICCAEISVFEDAIERGHKPELAKRRLKISKRNAERIIRPGLVDDDGPAIDLYAGR